MGWRTVVDVRDHSEARGSAYIVAVMLAERAPDETRIARPGIELLAKDARVDKRTCQRALKQLEELGEIVRLKEGRRGQAAEFFIALCAQGDNLPPKVRVTPDPNGAAETTPLHARQGDTGATPTEVTTNVSSEPDRREPKSDAFGADVDRLCKLMADLSNERAESKRFKATDTWRREMDRLMRLDGRTAEQIEYVIRWVHADSFWGPNVLAVPKLRQQFDQLVAKIRASRNGRGKSVGPSSDDLRRRAAALRKDGR